MRKWHHIARLHVMSHFEAACKKCFALRNLYFMEKVQFHICTPVNPLFEACLRRCICRYLAVKEDCGASLQHDVT